MAADGDDDPQPDPFRGVPIFGDLARMFANQGPLSWDAARQFALGIATGGTTEPNVDPLERIRIEQLARVAELHVADATGLVVPSSRGGSVEPVTRTTWVARTLDGYRPLLDRLAAALHDDNPTTPGDDPTDPMGWMAPLLQMVGPVMLGLTAGSMVGHLAERAFGQYELPLPRPVGQPVMVVPANLDAFADEWSLPGDDLRLWVCLHELSHHAVLSVPHVRSRLEGLLGEYLAAFEPDGTQLEERLGSLDPTQLGDPTSLPSLLGDPEVLLGAIRSPAQKALLPELEALVAPLLGYVDHVMDQIGAGLLGTYGQLTEALRRRRVEAGDADRFVERLFGLELTQGAYDRGRAFVDGVVERAGEPGLLRLWRSERELPTPAEVDAPGLWLARIDLPDD